MIDQSEISNTPSISVSRVGMLGYDSVGSGSGQNMMDDTASNISGSVSSFYTRSSMKNRNLILSNGNSSVRSNHSNNNNQSPEKPKKKFGILHHSIHFSSIGGLFSMQNLPNQKSFTDLGQKIFHGKGIRKLRSMKRRRNAKKSTKSYARRKKISQLMNSKWAMIVMIVATIYLLYIDDLLLTTLAPNTSASYNIVSVIKVIVFLIFVIDMIFQIYVQRLNYVLTLFFPIDLVSIASLVPDVIGYIFGLTSIVYALNSLSISRTARVARMASRLSRIARIINFFDVFQCGKRVQEKNKNEIQLSVEPSTIGKKLLSKTSHKIVVMCLLIVLITILTSPTLDQHKYFFSILELLVISATQNGLASPAFQAAFNDIQENRDTVDLLYLNINNTLVYQSPIDTDLWYPSYIIKIDSDNNEMWVNNQRNEQILAALSITMTTCLIIILCVGTLLISYDFQKLVIKPIERMISLIKKISSMDRGYGSDYDDSDQDEYTGGADGVDDEGGDAQMADMEVGGFSSGGESDFESFGDYGTEEHETEILVEVLTDLASKKMNNFNKEQQAQEAKQQVINGLNYLVAGIKAYSQRKHYNGELKVYSRRGRIVKELLTTEQSYVNSLNIAVEHFLIPIRTNSHISNEDSTTIFSNIEVVHQFNKGFLEIIEEKVNNWHFNQSIGESFSYMESATQSYSTYVNNYNNAIKALEDAKKEEKFAEFLQETREQKAKGIELVGYLIMPIQRMPRYVMLLEDLLKHTHQQHYDYEHIDNAVKNLKKITVQLNERKRESENKQSIQDIYMKLVPPVQDILVPGNSIVMQSKLKQDGDKFYFFLFNSGLLKAAKHENELHVKQYIPIKDIVVQLSVLQDVPSLKFFNAFQIKIEDEMVLVFAKTPEQRQEWITAFAQFTKVQTQRTKSVLMMNNHLRKSTISRNSLGGSLTQSQSPSLNHSRLSVSSASSKKQ
ncbi:hypothetical protein DICPUDRAFT_41248 [Dictyostelium purpureum]|uniref:DH domain-containing protein n=1 Tax=Dictyostelium purpureum TaxID=5786 RepID=F0ZZN9_DICPU|nr:uncharacterized protein DICPUDRAFT_41248 [Dictyostelium purpureum]EGC30596.1 hypothetical protein DICPUDRAFT_41248 [Dictyostelium purpureum]|eukprot:XP_003292884.1 hypothetical protein DICPUDRAFT_41248 [Dictyostelium purpureum]